MSGKRLLFSIARIVIAVLILVGLMGCFTSQPTILRNRTSDATVETKALESHVRMLSETLVPRDWTHVTNLNKCADYIAGHFAEAGATVQSQVFEVEGRQYRNVIGRFGKGTSDRIVVGAHYDACDDTPGADDNASGVAALIELAYLLGRTTNESDTELVAYVLEEPPFFRTKQMGSAVHAASIVDQKETIAGIIVLEMVGYFSDTKGSQTYPSRLLGLMYPSRGNFIGVVGAWNQGRWIKSVKTGMKGATDLPVYSIRAPRSVPGIDFSDHQSYWPHGFDALMVTDTAFYRNKGYHSTTDTWDKLDYQRMSKVVVAVFEAIGSIRVTHKEN